MMPSMISNMFTSKKAKAAAKKAAEDELHIRKSETVLKPECALKSRTNILDIAAKYPTPFHLYDEGLIRGQCMHLKCSNTHVSIYHLHPSAHKYRTAIVGAVDCKYALN